MNERMEEDREAEDNEEQAKALFEEIIDELKPGVLLIFSWGEKPDETRILSITEPGRKRILLTITQDALEDGADRTNKHRLIADAGKALRISESGRGVGVVSALI